MRRLNLVGLLVFVSLLLFSGVLARAQGADLRPADPPASADETSGRGLKFSGSGFLTLAVGRGLGGTSDPSANVGYDCPCFIADYGRGGIYENKRWQIGPDSRLGLQGTAATESGRHSVTAQVVAHGAQGGAAELEWLYGTTELSSELTLQVGRKRLPLLSYSEVQDVGYAYPWVRLSPQVYGWDIVNYNGANLMYRSRLGDASTMVNVFAGNETVKNSGYQKIYGGRDYRVDTRWANIFGIEGKVGLGDLDVRAVFITSDIQARDVSAGETDYSAAVRQKIWGGSLNYNHAGWVLRTEYIYINRRNDYGYDRAYELSAGRQFGRWMAMLSFSNYRQEVVDPTNPPEGHDTTALALRYELNHQSALKLQLDAWKDRSGPGYAYPHGDNRLLSAAYVRVF